MQLSKLEAILNSAVAAIVTIDTRGRIESINPATERMFAPIVLHCLTSGKTRYWAGG